MEENKKLNEKELEKVIGGFRYPEDQIGYGSICDCGGEQEDCPYCHGSGYIPDPDDPHNYIDGKFIGDWWKENQ